MTWEHVKHDLSHYVTSFYTQLYTSDADSSDTSEAQEMCWKNVPGMVTSDANDGLVSSLSVEEVSRAIKALPKGKAPGHDGIPMEFFHECVQEIAPDLHQAFTTLFNEGEISVYINKGIITLIPKSSDHVSLNN